MGAEPRNVPCGATPDVAARFGTSPVFLLQPGDVASRTFEDSAGVIWEVFQVHRASVAPRGVSAGLEHGWLSFTSERGKRRLAPFPSEWESVPELELERLCGLARVANAARYPREGGRSDVEQRSQLPADRAVRAGSRHADARAADELEEESLVRDTVRAFAHDARAHKLPAIEAMVRLKALLVERYGGEDVAPATRKDASDMRRVRRWFVEAFYFERTA